jgi:cytochrome P450
MVTRCHQQYGRAFTFPWFGFPLVWLIGPDANRFLLSEQPGNLLWRPALSSLIPFLGDGLIVTDGAQHDRLRRLVLPAFQRARMAGYLPIMWRYAVRYAARWQPGQVLDADLAMRRLALLIAGRAIFGVDLARQRAQLSRDFRECITYVDVQWPFNLVQADLPFTPWGRFVRTGARLDRFIYALIRQRQADLGPEPAVERDDALTALLTARDEDGTGLTPRQVRDQVMTLLAAGHETTAHGLAWTLYLLAQHPAVLDRVLAEQRTVLGGSAPTMDSARQLVYLEMVVKEALRLYPPAWAGGRVTAAEIEYQGYRFPPGTFVMYCQWLSHRLPDVFAEPERFRPERFDPDHGEAHPQFAYVPFGGGARLCIGMTFALLEMKVVLSALLARWRLDLEPGQRIVPHPLVTLAPRGGIRMRVREP